MKKGNRYSHIILKINFKQNQFFKSNLVFGNRTGNREAQYNRYQNSFPNRHKGELVLEFINIVIKWAQCKPIEFFQHKAAIVSIVGLQAPSFTIRIDKRIKYFKLYFI